MIYIVFLRLFWYNLMYQQSEERFLKLKIVLQRVLGASVEVDNNVVGKINKGYVIFLGVSNEDTEQDVERLAAKIINLRIFSDENDKINLSLKDVNGELLIISQFTLYGDTKKGNRPSFIMAEEPDKANNMYEEFVKRVKEVSGREVQKGVFGADMKVELLNDGPVTILVESPFSKED